jgi:hypothetical protein
MPEAPCSRGDGANIWMPLASPLNTVASSLQALVNAAMLRDIDHGFYYSSIATQPHIGCEAEVVCVLELL